MPSPLSNSTFLKRSVAALKRGDHRAAWADARRAAATAPDAAVAASLTGTVASQAGRHSTALRWFKLVLSLVPDDDYALGNIVQLSRINLDFDCAADGLTRLTRRAPGNVEAWRQLVDVRLSQPSESAAAARAGLRLVLLDPGSATGYAAMASGARSIDNPAPLLRISRFGLAAEPANVWCRSVRATLLELAYDPAGSRMETQRACLVEPAHETFWLAMADRAERGGRPDEALRLAARSRVLRTRGVVVELIAGRALFARGQTAEAEAVLREILDRPDLTERQRSGASFTLGWVLDRGGRTDEAFTRFLEANRLSTATQAGRLCKPTAYRQQIRAYDEHLETVAARGESGARGHAPVFLVGFPRSGTTLLDQFLDAHPKLTTLEERPYLSNVAWALSREGADYRSGASPLGSERLERMRDRYLAQLDSESPDRTLVRIDKMPLNMAEVSLIWRLFPDARFVFAIRHPADVCLSCFMQEFEPNNMVANFDTVENAARLYDLAMRHWSRARELLDLTVHEIRYENLLADKETETAAILDFLDLPWDEAVRDHVAHARSRAVRTASYSQVRQPLYTHARYRWLRYRARMVDALPVLAPWIARFGYPGVEVT